jgi:hypothetical protein
MFSLWAVIPAKAGIHGRHNGLDARLRGHDDVKVCACAGMTVLSSCSQRTPARWAW